VKTFYVYMLTNKGRVVLYTGVTNSLEVRVWQHRRCVIDGFTKKYHVDRLVYYASFDDPRDAISREKEIKGWRRSKKNVLVETLNPKWADLSATFFEQSRGPSHSLGMTNGQGVITQ
jgi:putative endonuclease